MFFLGLLPPPLLMMSAAESQSRIKGKKSLEVLVARAGHFEEGYREIPRDLCKCSCTLFTLGRHQRTPSLQILCKQHPHPSHFCCWRPVNLPYHWVFSAISTQPVLSRSPADGWRPPSEINSHSLCRRCVRWGFIFSVPRAGCSQVSFSCLPLLEQR